MSIDNAPEPEPRELEADHHGGPTLPGDVVLIVFTSIMLLLYVTGVFTRIFGVDTALIMTLVGGYSVFWASLRKAATGRLDGDLAVTVAAIAALAIGQFAAAAEVVLIVLIGKALEFAAVCRTRGAIADLLRLVPRTASVLRGGSEIVVQTQFLRAGDRVLVRPGDRVPVDGVIRRGRSSIDSSLLTGESIPIVRADGELVHAGTINLTALLEVDTTAVGAQTVLAKIAGEVAEAERRKAPAQRLADSWGRPFILLVLCAGAATFFTWSILLQAPLDIALTRMASTLIIACPCALILATPTGIAAVMGRLARRGVLARGGDAVEALSNIDCVIFDKTGTLTLGRPSVAAVSVLDGRSEHELLRLAATAQQVSVHPLARCLVSSWKAVSSEPLLPLESAVEMPGLGTVTLQNGRRILVGGEGLLDAHQIPISADAHTRAAAMAAHGQTVLFVAEDTAVIALIAVSDVVRPEAAATVGSLEAAGIRRVEMLTGDSVDVASAVASECGIAIFEARLLPADKAARVRARQTNGYRVAFIGDGINDAPALAAADVGIAVAHGGADIAVEAAGIVLVSDNLTRVPEAILLCRRALQVIKRNIAIYGIVLNVLAVAVSAAGGLAWFGSVLQARWPTLFGSPGRDLSPMLAALLHQAASLLVIGSALRLLTVRIDPRPGGQSRAPVLRTLFTRMGKAMTSLTAMEFIASVAERIAETAREYPARWTALGTLCAVVLWALTGLYCVPAGGTAVVLRFGRLSTSRVPPGLHYRLPWPIEDATTVDVTHVRRIEIGFRTLRPETTQSPALPDSTPSEWNSLHAGSMQRVADESVLLTGDEYLADANLTIQYRVRSPETYLFHVADAEMLLRQSAEAALHRAMGRTSLGILLTTGRAALESDVRLRTQEDCDRFETGLLVLEARVQEVHPPQEVVAAYRDVSSAVEEKSAAIDQADAYRNETIPQSRGQAAQNVLQAQSYTIDRTRHATGDSSRFVQTLAGFRRGPEVNAQRLYLETIERALVTPGKLVLDSHASGRRHIWLADGPLYNLPAPPISESPATLPPVGEQP